MPIQKCSRDGKPGFKWGEHGKCYTYTPGSKHEKELAKALALKQGRAIKARQTRAVGEKQEEVASKERKRNLQEFADEFAKKSFGHTRTEALAGWVCVVCGGSASVFRDELSRREYEISGLCQKCQDKVFKEE